MTFWNILRPFGIIYSILVCLWSFVIFFPFWYVWTKKIRQPCRGTTKPSGRTNSNPFGQNRHFSGFPKRVNKRLVSSNELGVAFTHAGKKVTALKWLLISNKISTWPTREQLWGKKSGADSTKVYKLIWSAFGEKRGLSVEWICPSLSKPMKMTILIISGKITSLFLWDWSSDLIPITYFKASKFFAPLVDSLPLKWYDLCVGGGDPGCELRLYCGQETRHFVLKYKIN
jgi:hypothetical protein